MVRNFRHPMPALEQTEGLVHNHSLLYADGETRESEMLAERERKDM